MGAFGEYFKALRVKRGLSLRQFCATNGFDPGNISRLERGLFLPPESETKLKDYARALRLRLGSDEWIDFFDRAAAERGMIPHDLQNNEKLVRQLPVLFRTLRGQRVSRESLEKLVEMIRAVNLHGI